MTLEHSITFDKELLPPAVRPVIVLSGSMHDMGLQYGAQAAPLLARNSAVIASEVLPMWGGNWASVIEQMDKYASLIAAENPGIIDLWKGMAEGSGLDYYDILMINLSLPLLIMAPQEKIDGARHSLCSTFSAWGSRTAGGTLHGSANLDQGWNMGTHTVVIVAFPDDGYPFIAAPPWAGELIGSAAINSEGLAMLGSAGQDGGDGDYAVGIPNMTARLIALLTASTVDEAIDRYLTVHPSNSENAHFLDPNGAKLVEYTPAHHAVRTSGEYGEKDYLVATNHFVSGEMQSSLVGGEYNDGWYDAIPRYNTYVKLLDGAEELDVDGIASVLASHDYWSESEGWNRDVYSLEPAIDPQSCWSPEMRGPEWKTLMKSIVVPEERTIYLMNGESDRRMSTLPDATGEYSKLVLKGSVGAIADAAIEDAKLDIWHAGSRLNTAENVSPERDEIFEKARRALWKGFNYRASARLSASVDAWASDMGRALTYFTEAQTFAKMAMRGLGTEK